MKSKKYSELEQKRLLQTKPTILSASERLTRSEIDSLRQKKKQLNDYGLKAFSDRMQAKGL